MKQDNSSGYAALRDAAAIVDLPFGRVRLRGADRRAYLQGLLTNDIAALTPGTGCYAAMLTAQGRMITDMRVLELGDEVLLDVPLALTSNVRDHLDRFVFAEDVQVDEVTATVAELGLYGPTAVDVLQAAGVEGAAAATLYSVTRIRAGGRTATLVRADTIGIPGFDLLVDAMDAETVRAALLRGGAVPATSDDVEAVRIESGRPWFGRDLDADTIPLEAGLEARAISRSKGCYVGQEVIVRVQDRGHGRVARRLVGLTFDAASPLPVAGTGVTAAGRDVGRITSAIVSPALARPIALAYVQRDFVEPGTHVQAGGQDAIVAALPFV